ncbi:MAG: hypothetical protein JKY08_05620 [Flavobacteriaceae bacterium]|nr:hypothetical protein [Flavobacteriaceae bacterium]
MKIASKIFAILIAVLVVSCSTKKNSFVSRNFHTLTTKYNVLHNGKESFKQGLAEINASYNDNYWELLPIEPLKVEEETTSTEAIDSSETKATGPFAFAEEKSVKAIQRHSMNFHGREHNRQIDDAYLLLGKARYYSSRFVPAIEAFNYVIEHYPTANLIAETKIWQAKTQVRLHNEEQAIISLKYLLESTRLEKEIIESAHTALAMAYVATDSIQLAIDHLQKSVLTDSNKHQHARNLFILGQLYRTQHKIDSSNYSFDKVIAYKKSAYKYVIHSQIEKAINTSKGNKQGLERLFAKLIKNRDNRPFLDKLYYQAGNIALDLNKEADAMMFYKKSIHAKQAENHQKSLSYQALGDFNFMKSKYIVAGAYYDSILSIATDNNSKRIRKIKRKRANLDDVITQEFIASTTDSILSVISLDQGGRIAYFEKHIQELKKTDAAKKTTQKTYTTGFGNPITSNNTNSNTSGTWYFYNVQSIGFGAQEFVQIWGNRPLEDNWRISTKRILQKNLTQKTTAKELDTIASKRYDLDFYLSQIPTAQKDIDSIRISRNTAYFNLGIIYKEQFNIKEVAITKFEKLLAFPKNTTWILPSHYHLFKLYAGISMEKSDRHKQQILDQYPASRYAQIILNPNKVLAQANSEDAPEKVYANTYYLYKDQKYTEVVSKASASILLFNGNPIVPKFELLRAYSLRKTVGKVAFKEALEFILISYPNTDEAAQAATLINQLKK